MPSLLTQRNTFKNKTNNNKNVDSLSFFSMTVCVAYFIFYLTGDLDNVQFLERMQAA